MAAFHNLRVADVPRSGCSSLEALTDWVLALRDRLLVSPRFMAWASRFPLTRPIARRRSHALFDLCAGFVYSQILATCVSLKLFNMLAENPQSADTLAPRLGVSPYRAQQLLEAAAALRLVSPRGRNRYGLGPLGAAVLGNEGVARMIDHHALLYDDLQDPVALLRDESRETSLGRYWSYAAAPSPSVLRNDETDAYMALMAASQPMIADEVLAAYPFHKHHSIMDVGGGNGAFLSAAAKRLKHQNLTLFDLPPVAESAASTFAAEDLAADRIAIVGGDFFTDPLPQDVDAVTLLRVLHDHDDDKALLLLQSIRHVLPQNGVLILAEPMAGARGAASVGAYFGFYLLAMGSGRPRREAEIVSMIKQAGFTSVQSLPSRNPLIVKILKAQP